MKKVVIKGLFLFAVYVASLLIFMLMLNRQESFSTISMSEATLPVLYMREDGVTVNRMYGHRQEINETTFRESLTPVSVDKTLNVEIQTYGADINSVDYQVTSLVDGSVLENGRLSLESESDRLVSEFTLNSQLAIGQEYMLSFSVDIGEDEPVKYYTRIAQNNSQNLSYYLEYADAFYQNCISNTLTSEMRSQIQTDSAYVASSLHYVTLMSDEEQIVWGNMEPTLVKTAVPTILEVNETTVSIGMEYIVSAQNDEGETEYYIASEYYRMRIYRGDIVLLNYERTVTQFFDGTISVLTSDGISLGVTGSSVDYAHNSSKDVVAFVQAGELWQYDRSANKVCRIFSFRGDSYTDERYLNDSYGISISYVSDEGNTTFMVYGYMVAGEHEGTLGICVYRYYSETNTTREIAYIPIDDAYDLISSGLDILSYTNGDDECFIYYDDDIYCIRLGDDSEVEVVKEGVSEEEISVSDSQNLVSWAEGDGEGYSDTIYELNLETGEAVSIEAPDGDYIATLGYVGEDMVYGLAHASDCYIDSGGDEVFPIYKLCIIDSSGEIVREYEIEGIYITDVEIDDGLVMLKRAYYNENGNLRSTTDDLLIYYTPEEDTYINVSLRVSERNGTLVRFSFSVSGETSNLLSMDTRYPADSSSESIEIDGMEYDNQYYYVYAHGGLYAFYDQLNEAVTVANENVGIVLDASQKYIWERGNISTAFTVEIAQIPDAILSATDTDEEAISQDIGDGYEVLNYTGCVLETIKYQISNGYAVVARWSSDEVVVIVGYDIYDNIWLYDGEGSSYAVTGEDAEAAFEDCGNEFISYRRSS